VFVVVTDSTACVRGRRPSAGLRSRADRLRRLVATNEPALVCSAAMGADVGPGLVGVAWLAPT
jgi:hypothetical protein